MMLFLLMLIIPWLATFLGSTIGIKINFNNTKKQDALLGFAAGIMVAASIWSLIIPSFDENNRIQSLVVCSLGFLLGIFLMLILDKQLPHQHFQSEQPEGHVSKIKKPMLLVLAVALHNIPEGLALGVIMAGTFNETLSYSAALIFLAGLALQNFPEGIAVVLPLKDSNVSNKKCFKFGLIASIAEPIAALFGLGLVFLLTSLGTIIMPLLLCIAAGAMIFIIVEELIPASQISRIGHIATYGFLIGFWIMAIIALMWS